MGMQCGQMNEEKYSRPYILNFQGGVMQGNRYVNFFRHSIVTLIICAVSFDMHVNTVFAADTEPLIRRPHIVGGTYKFEDIPNAYEVEYGTRTFEIPTGPGQSIKLDTVYKSNLSRSQQENPIFVLGGGESGFGELYKQEMGSSKYWQYIKVHLGYYTQDGCSDDVSVIYTLSNSTVIAKFFDKTVNDIIRNDLHCGWSDFDLDIDESRDTNWGSKLCTLQQRCVKKYFKNPANRKKLQSSLLETVRTLNVK
jgi:hypothetical protein